MATRSKQLAICVKNGSYWVSLELRKLYLVLADPDAARRHQIRVID